MSDELDRKAFKLAWGVFEEHWPSGEMRGSEVLRLAIQTYESARLEKLQQENRVLREALNKCIGYCKADLNGMLKPENQCVTLAIIDFTYEALKEVGD